MTLINDNGNWADLLVLIDGDLVKHYSFDFWNTIAYSNPQFKKERVKYISELLNLINKEEQINSAFTLIGEEYNLLMENKSVILSPEALYLKVIKQLKYNEEVDIKKIVEDIELLFLKYPPIICSGFLNFLELIDNENITISIASNTAFIPGRIIQKNLESNGLLSKIKFCLFSDIEKFAKPNKSLFGKVYANTQKINPAIKLIEIIHIGDNLKADYLGAKTMGFQAFHLTSNHSYSYPRYSLHSIKDKTILPFLSTDYSRFKFGDFKTAENFAKELFDFFKIQHIDDTLKDSKSIIIYSSPYSHIPTSSYYLTSEFLKLFTNYLDSITENKIKVKLGKINRSQSYTEDYGAMNARQRYDLIKNDTYSFFDVPEENSFCIFIDDISITGTHQRIIENMMRNKNYKNKSIFLYYAKLDNPAIEAPFENDLNFTYVNSIEKLIQIIISDTFKNTTRTTKYILSLCDSDLKYLLKLIIEANKPEIISDIYYSAILNNYEKIQLYKNNLNELQSFINKSKQL